MTCSPTGIMFGTVLCMTRFEAYRRKKIWQSYGRKTSKFIAMLSLACLGSNCSRFARPTVSTVDQEIIEAVIADNEDSASTKRGLFEHSSVRLALIGDLTYPTLANELRKNAAYRDQAFHEALEDFLRANGWETAKTKLIFPRKLPDSIVLVPDDEVRKIQKNMRTLEEAQGAIRARFGAIDGIYQVSKPGVDAHRTVALICLSYSSAPGTVTGRFYILKFNGAKWIVDKEDLFGPSWTS